MKKLLALVLAALLTSAAFAADQVPVFNATLTVGKEYHFILIGAAGKRSEFLKVGETFEGYKLKGYDAKSGVLELERDGKVTPLTLNDGALTNAPAAAAPATIADAKAVLDSMNFEKMMDRTLAGIRQSQGAMVDNMMKQLGQTGADREALVAFQKKMIDEMMGAMTGAEMKDDVAKAYSEVFTKSELQDLAAFYSSPIGQTFSDKTPALQQKMNEVMVPRMMSAMPKVQKMAQDFAMEQRAKRNAAKEGAPAPAPAPAPQAK